MKNILYAVILIVIVGLVTIWFTDIKEVTAQEYGIDIVDKNKGINEKNELFKAQEKILWLEETIRSILVLNESRISKTNCQGLFYDANEDNVYDRKLFGESFEFNENVVFHYNFCSYNQSSEKSISIIATTKVLLKDHLVSGKIEQNFVPSYMIKTFLIQKDKNSDKEVVVETTTGLIDTQIIMNY